MGMHGNMVSFNSGELSPLVSARSDISQYSSGCKKLENFLVTPYGCVIRRPGLKFIASAKYHDKKFRMIPFSFSTTQNYMLEFGEKYVRIFSNDIPVCDASGNLIELVSPFLESDLPTIKFVQSADVLFLVHPLYFPRRISRVSVTEFTLDLFPIAFPPLKDINITDTTITPSAVNGSGITLTASASIFETGHIGSYWEILHIRQNSTIAGSLTAVITGAHANDNAPAPAGSYSASLLTKGKWGLITRGIWTGTIIIQKSFDNGATWIDFRSYSSSADKNYDVSGEETEDGVYYRLIRKVSASGILNYEFKNDNFYNHGVVKIVSVASGTSATADVIKILGGTTATKDWTEAAWSESAGYPKAVAFYEERIVFAGTADQPQTIWGSKTGEWDDFRIGDYDDDAFCFTIAADDVNSIQWLIQHDALLFGTVAAEWKLAPTSADKPLSPSNVSIKRQSKYGSSSIQAELVGDVVLFVQRSGRKVREFVYDFQKDGYVSPDLTMLSNRVTAANYSNSAGLSYIALQQQPDMVMWGIRGDGQSAALTYERDQGVVGWHRHITDGEFESVARIPGAMDDEIWFAVKRTIQGKTARYIEKFTNRNYDSLADAYLSDCAIRVKNVTGTEVSGLGHLEGKTVQVTVNGAPVKPDPVVSGGKITLAQPVKSASIIAGLGYSSKLIPMPLDVQWNDGTIAYRPKRISNVSVKFFETIGGTVQVNDGPVNSITTRTVADPVNTPLTPFSGWVNFTAGGGYNQEMLIEIVQDQPLPMTVLNIVPVFEVH